MSDAQPDAVTPPPPNPAVTSILRGAAPTAPTPVTPIASAPSANVRPGLSMHPEAVRARARRAQRSGRAAPAAAAAPPTPRATARESFARSQPPANGPRLTPEQLRAEISSLPAPPVVASPEQIKAASNFVSMAIRAAGWVAAAVFKSDDMKVPEADAQETARLIVDGWPELATSDTADAKKTLAVMAVGSLVAERYGKYQRRAAPERRVLTPPPATEQGRLPHEPISA